MEKRPKNYRDIIGQRFGRLVVLEERREIIKSHYRYFCKCQCDCGTVKEIEKSKLLSGEVRSCRCLQRELASKRARKPDGIAAFNETYGAYIKSARLRGYSFELTKEEFRQIATQPCTYCGDALTQCKRRKSRYGTGEWWYTGIDRYDNTKGYTVENSVPCCKKCNRIKTDMTVEEMEEQLIKIISRKDMWRRTS